MTCVQKSSKGFKNVQNVQKCSNTFKIVQNCSKVFPCSQLNVTFRDEMPRAATNKRVRTKPAAKPKSGTEKGAGKQPAKKKTATGGARVALNVPHVAADKPHEEGRAATVLDRAVLLPRHLVPLCDAKVRASVVFSALVYGHVRDGSVQGKVSIALAGGWEFELDTAAVQQYWLQPDALTAALAASLRAAIVEPTSAEAQAGDAANVDRSGAASSSRAARRAPVAVRRPGAPLTFSRRCVTCMHALRRWHADERFLAFGAVVMPPYFANHDGLETDDGKRGWEGQVAPTVRRDGEPLTIGFFDAAAMTDGGGNMQVFFREGAKVLPRDTCADFAVRDDEQADETFRNHFERVMRGRLDAILADDAKVRERNPHMPLLDLDTIAADPPGILSAVRRMQRHASGHVHGCARAPCVHSSVATC